jgi:hypothetical protein
VPVLLGPPFFQIILFGSHTLLTGMTGISLHMQWTHLADGVCGRADPDVRGHLLLAGGGLLHLPLALRQLVVQLRHLGSI